MTKQEIESLQRWLKLDEDCLRITKESIANAKWYQPIFKVAMRKLVVELESRIKSQSEGIEREIKKHYKL